MNMLAAAAEAAMWPTNGIVGVPVDRSVVDTVIAEFSERMGELARYMAEIYGGTVADYLTDLKWSRLVGGSNDL